MKNQKGITLVALVVTIVVLLILAAVSINIAFNGGIFAQAKDATQKTANGIDYEANKLPVEMQEFMNNALTGVGATN